ncbi:Putative coenzyme F420-dependent oxidoreductase [Paraconexibacter sp. AEG42_29]|uniref:Coenzyme F420-dependent oxidoreductase n=1 Tax=Paraconexibacter sp. AEG42_29 TaxID=2997339 RepID=A0AAU7B3H3_9ACTN
MPRLGLAVPIDGLGFTESLELALEAERLGYTDAWAYEVNGSDGFTPLAWLAARSTTLRLGISLVPVFTRPPALLAMSSASLHHLSGGRFVLGLGSSSPNVVDRWMGGEHSRPLTRVRETVEAVRLALSGDKAAYRGTTLRMDDFRLGLPGAQVPIQLGALGPRMYRQAGAIGDGVITVFNTAAATPALLEDFYAGAAEAGRDPSTLDVVSKLFVAVDEDLDDLRPMLQRFLTGYGTVPAYNALLRRQGFAAEASAMADAWADGRRADAMAAVTDELLRALIVCGSAAECAEQLGGFVEAGVRTLLVAPITAATGDERRARLEHTIEAVARMIDTVAVDTGETPELY